MLFMSFKLNILTQSFQNSFYKLAFFSEKYILKYLPQIYLWTDEQVQLFFLTYQVYIFVTYFPLAH